MEWKMSYPHETIPNTKCILCLLTIRLNRVRRSSYRNYTFEISEVSYHFYCFYNKKLFLHDHHYYLSYLTTTTEFVLEDEGRRALNRRFSVFCPLLIYNLNVVSFYFPNLNRGIFSIWTQLTHVHPLIRIRSVYCLKRYSKRAAVNF